MKFGGLKIQENILLSEHTTFRIGGPARYFFIANSEEDLLSAIKAAKENGLPFFVLGGGSNVLFSDNGFDGLVIKCNMSKMETNESGRVQAEAGVNWNSLVKKSSQAGFIGLEWGAGIPGTFGGAVCGNVGAYGHSVSEFAEEIKFFDGEKIKTISTGDCGFEYRGSIFKNNKNLIILSGVFRLAKGDAQKSAMEINRILAERAKKIPDAFCAGSFFKNIIFEKQSESFKKMILPELVKDGKVAAGFLISERGLKGKKIGKAQISQQHSNFIINTGDATSKDVLALAELCKKEVREKFGVELEEEVKIVI